MTSRSSLTTIVLAYVCLLSSTGFTAEVPSVAETMKIVPKQRDVEYDTPKEAELAKCKVEVERKGKSVGLVVLGPGGQILRKIVDTDGDNQYDQWRFYHLGIEVYREIDTNKNNKPDQYRWLNRGGSRWGIDKNEDSHIDQWKVLSATEASREAVRAMINQDVAALQAVLVNADDLKSLGISPPLSAKIMESASDAEKKLKDIMKKSKVFTAQSKWARFEAHLPGIIPLEDEKSKEELYVFESAYANIETPKKDGTSKIDLVQMGEMIRVGEVWKLTQVPLPLDGEPVTTNPVLMEPVLQSQSTEGNSPAPSQKVAQALKELQELDEKVLKANQEKLAPKQVKALMVRRAAILKEAIELAQTPDEKISIVKQNIDVLYILAGAGIYPEGASELQAIETDVLKKSPESPLLPYVVYRRIQAAYSVDLRATDDNEKNEKKDKNEKKEKQADIQKAWLKSLEEFTSKYPNADDCDDALLTLGTQEEFQGKPKEASVWYQKLIKDRPKSNMVPRVQGILKRLSLEGQPLVLDGPLLSGGTLNVKALKGQVILVVFWNSEYQTCEEDIPSLRALYRDYQKNGFEIIGIALDSDKTEVQKYVKKNEMTWPQIFQPGQQNQSGGIDSPLAISFGIISFPTMILVDAEGKVVSRNANLTEIKTELPGLLNPKKK